MQFKDINFKFSVISALHEEGFYVAEAKALNDQYGDEDDFSYKPIPEVYEYYKNLEIDPEKLALVTSLYPDGGDQCYMYLMNNWDGEDDTFDISSIEGIEHLPNLKIFDPVSMITADGIDFAPFLKCEKLEEVNAEVMRDTEENRGVISQLKERGVEVTGL